MSLTLIKISYITIQPIQVNIQVLIKNTFFLLLLCVYDIMVNFNLLTLNHHYVIHCNHYALN